MEILEHILLNLQKTNPDRNKQLIVDGLEKAREEGRQEVKKEMDAYLGLGTYGYLEKIRQEERTRIISLIEGMQWKVGQFNLTPTDKDLGYNQALEVLLDKLGDKNE